MKPHLLAAEIARLVPELAKDSAVNRETLIRGLLDDAKRDLLLRVADKVAAHRGTREQAVQIILQTT